MQPFSGNQAGDLKCSKIGLVFTEQVFEHFLDLLDGEGLVQESVGLFADDEILSAAGGES